MYHRPRLVLEALASVLAQTHQPDRVVVVDDGSTDRTVASVREWMLANGVPENWSLIESEHRGAAAARNAGLEQASGSDWISFLDSDDLWPIDFLARASAVLTQQGSLVGVSADRLTQDGKDGTERRECVARLSRDPFRWAVHNGLGIGSCSVLNTRTVIEAGGYPVDEVTGHDIVLFTRLFDRGPWGHVPGAPVVFRRNHAPESGEQDHICRSVNDANERWVRLYESAMDLQPKRVSGSITVRRAMARRWLSAAKSCYRSGRLNAGRDCLRRSGEYWPFAPQLLKWRLRFRAKGRA